MNGHAATAGMEPLTHMCKGVMVCRKGEGEYEGVIGWLRVRACSRRGLMVWLCGGLCEMLPLLLCDLSVSTVESSSWVLPCACASRLTSLERQNRSHTQVRPSHRFHTSFAPHHDSPAMHEGVMVGGRLSVRTSQLQNVMRAL